MKKRRNKLNLKLTFFVFLILFLSNVAIIALLLLLYLCGVINTWGAAPLVMGIIVLGASVLVSTVGYGFFAMLFFRPLNELIAATKRVAAGGFYCAGQGDLAEEPSRHSSERDQHAHPFLQRDDA